MSRALKLFAFIVVAIGLSSFVGNTTYKIDPAKSGMTWHMPITSGEHYGTINVNSGYIVYDGTTISSGVFTVDINSVKDLDLSREKQPAIEKHIKSEDFFEVAKYPVATFKIDNVARNEKGILTAHGALTIKGITKPISFPFKMRTWEGKVYVDAESIEIKRKDFGLTIKNKGIKGSMEEAVIYDVFKVGFSIALK
jgi:polyisoprenoid-binding protein YceI